MKRMNNSEDSHNCGLSFDPHFFFCKQMMKLETVWDPLGNVALLTSSLDERLSQPVKLGNQAIVSWPFGSSSIPGTSKALVKETVFFSTPSF